MPNEEQIITYVALVVFSILVGIVIERYLQRHRQRREHKQLKADWMWMKPNSQGEIYSRDGWKIITCQRTLERFSGKTRTSSTAFAWRLEEHLNKTGFCVSPEEKTS